MSETFPPQEVLYSKQTLQGEVRVRVQKVLPEDVPERGSLGLHRSVLALADKTPLQ